VSWNPVDYPRHARIAAPLKPGETGPLPEQPFDLTPLFDGGMAWVLGGVLVTLLIFGLALLIGRRRPLS
jgi:hypothetical protein